MAIPDVLFPSVSDVISTSEFAKQDPAEISVIFAVGLTTIWLAYVCVISSLETLLNVYTDEATSTTLKANLHSYVQEWQTDCLNPKVDMWGPHRLQTASDICSTLPIRELSFFTGRGGSLFVGEGTFLGWSEGWPKFFQGTKRGGQNFFEGPKGVNFFFKRSFFFFATSAHYLILFPDI